MRISNNTFIEIANSVFDGHSIELMQTYGNTVIREKDIKAYGIKKIVSVANKLFNDKFTIRSYIHNDATPRKPAQRHYVIERMER